jgi:preprotein translocase subunit SecF
MKKTLFTLAVIAFIAGSIFTGCQSSATKVENAENKLLEAQQNLNQTRMDSMNEYLEFKKISQDKIIAQEKSIAEFKIRIAKEKKENRDKYEKKLADLEQQNTDMTKKLEDYKLEGKDKWAMFKEEFNHDMEELGKALNDLTNKNIK